MFDDYHYINLLVGNTWFNEFKGGTALQTEVKHVLRSSSKLSTFFEKKNDYLEADIV